MSQSLAEFYRENEARERELARAETLPRITELRQKAAEKWSNLAIRAEQSDRELVAARLGKPVAKI